MQIAGLINQANNLTPASIQRAQEIDYTTSGDRLGRVMRSTMEESPGPYQRVREAVNERISDLGGAGQAEMLFKLAADMATTAAVANDIEESERHTLCRLWNDLVEAQAFQVTSLTPDLILD